MYLVILMDLRTSIELVIAPPTDQFYAAGLDEFVFNSVTAHWCLVWVVSSVIF
jgi:hypothetical protein